MPRSNARTGACSKDSRVVAAVALGLAVWALEIWALAGVGEGSKDAANDGHRAHGAQYDDAAADAGPELVRIEDEYQWDIFDERLLVGYSDTVFAGRVLEKVGSEAAWTSIPNDDEDPHTQYAVEVLDVVKATGPAPISAGERAVVDQLGGRGEKTGKVHVAGAISCGHEVIDAPLLPGREYMFATLYDADERRYAMSAPPAGAVELGGPEEREALVAAYERAAEEQVNPLSPEAADSCG